MKTTYLRASWLMLIAAFAVAQASAGWDGFGAPPTATPPNPGYPQVAQLRGFGQFGPFGRGAVNNNRGSMMRLPAATNSPWSAGSPFAGPVPNAACVSGGCASGPVMSGPMMPGPVPYGSPTPAMPPMNMGGPPIMTSPAPAAMAPLATNSTNLAPFPAASPAVAGPVIGGPYMDAMSAPWCDAPVAPVFQPRVASAPTWFGGIYGLVMDRDDENEIYFLTAPATPDTLLLSSQEAQMETSGGFEARIGRTFDCGRWGLEFVYWELFPDDQSAFVTAAAAGVPLYTTMDYRDILVDPDGGGMVPADMITESGVITSTCLHRSFDFQNIELNLLSRPIYVGGGLRAGRSRPFGPGYAGRIGGGGCFGGCRGGRGPAAGSAGCGSNCGDCGPCGPGMSCPPRLHIGWMFGVRYFKFDEALTLINYIADPVVPAAEIPAMTHFVEAENDLVGAQLGLNMDYYLTQRFHIEAGTRFGLYGNHMTVTQQLYSDFGFARVNDPLAPQDFDIRASDTDISFLGELRVGAAYKLGCHWRLTGGYRAMAASRVALATNQFPFGRSFTGVTKAAEVNPNGDLILHGAYAGIEFAW